MTRRMGARGLSGSLSFRNLFGADYTEPASVEHVERSIAQDGRTAIVRATWRF